jgi:tetratricopeptide (TPR) repeat protein
MGNLRRLLLALPVLGCLVVPAPEAATKWTRLKSANFQFVGDADEREIRRVALKLEQFRETLIRAFGEGAGLAPVPTVVFVFANDRSFTPYKPHYRGKPIQVAGYFQGGEHANYIALVPGREADDYRTIFHEYTHFIVNNLIGVVPPWINEGLAGFYETFEERDNGRSVIIGRPAGAYIEALRGRPMPLAELMNVERSSPVYNEGDRRGIFYAQSWAFVHYLQGNPARGGQLTTYLSHIRTGAEPAAAFTAAFKTDTRTLEQELESYLSRFLFTATEFKFPERTGNGGVQKGGPIDDREARAYLAELVAMFGRPDEALALLKGVGEDSAASPRALSALGGLELRAGRADAAMPLLERAAQLAPSDGWIQGVYGRALNDRLRAVRGDRAAHAELLPKVKAVLTTATSLSPVSVSTLIALALVELEPGQDFARARSLIEAAIRQAPSRENYRLLLGQVLMSQREFDAALAIFGPLAATGSQPAIRDQARSLQQTVADRRQQLAELTARNQARAAALGASPNTMPGSSSSTPSVPESLTPPPAAAPLRILALRPVGAGEERLRASFEAIQCSEAGLVLQFRLGADLVHFSAPRLDQVDFVSHRNDSGSAIRCGALPKPLEALVTFRPAAPGQAGVRGQVIAVELIPDDYLL